MFTKKSRGTKLPTLTVGVTGADYTTIQDALDAMVTFSPSGGRIFITDKIITQTTPIIFKSTGVFIEGNGSGTQINVDAAVVPTLISQNGTNYTGLGLDNITLNQTNATVQGTAMDFSNTSLGFTRGRVRILGFGTVLRLDDTANHTFYNKFDDVEVFNCNNAINGSSTNPLNDNYFTNWRISLRAGGNGKALYLNNAQSNHFLNFNCEPTTGTGITGIHLDTVNTFNNTFTNMYLENNDTGLNVTDAINNQFFGGRIVSSLTANYTDTGKKTQFFGTMIGGSVVNTYSAFTGLDSSNASETFNFKNNATFAHVASKLVDVELLNTTDTSDALTAGTQGTTGLALNIKNSFAVKAGTNYSTVGVTSDVVFSNHSYIRTTGATAQTITGIANGVNGKKLTLYNTASTPLTIKHLDTSSTAANRIKNPTATDFLVTTGRSVDLIYDSGASNWIVQNDPMQVKTTTVSTDYTMKDADTSLYIDSSAASIIITMPNNVEENRQIAVTYLQTSNTITFTGSGTTVVSPVTYLPIASFIAPGSVGQVGTLRFYRIGSVWYFNS